MSTNPVTTKNFGDFRQPIASNSINVPVQDYGTIDVDVNVQLDEQNQPIGASLSMAANDQYFTVPEGGIATVRWHLGDPPVGTVKFDSPALMFLGGEVPDCASTRLTDGKTVEATFYNLNPKFRGLSFLYRLVALVTIGTGTSALILPATQDPTVHNEPPTP